MAFTRYLLICKEKGIERIVKEECGVAGIAIPRVGEEIEHLSPASKGCASARQVYRVKEVRYPITDEPEREATPGLAIPRRTALLGDYPIVYVELIKSKDRKRSSKN